MSTEPSLGIASDARVAAQAVYDEVAAGLAPQLKDADQESREQVEGISAAIVTLVLAGDSTTLSNAAARIWLDGPRRRWVLDLLGHLAPDARPDLVRKVIWLADTTSAVSDLTVTQLLECTGENERVQLLRETTMLFEGSVAAIAKSLQRAPSLGADMARKRLGALITAESVLRHCWGYFPGDRNVVGFHVPPVPEPVLTFVDAMVLIAEGVVQAHTTGEFEALRRGVLCEDERKEQAVRAVEHYLAQRAKAPDRLEQVSEALWRDLCALDANFERIDAARVATALEQAADDSRGGAKRLRAFGVLGFLAGEAHALDANGCIEANAKMLRAATWRRRS